MSRPMLIIMTVLLTATGTGLVSFATQVQHASGVADTSVAAQEAVVRRFYAAVNETIATGRVDGLKQVVDASYTDRSPIPGERPGRQGLGERLLRLHASDPNASVTVDSLISAADSVVVRISIDSTRDEALAGLPVANRPRWWPQVDILRIRQNRIVERWSGLNGLAVIDPPVSVTLKLPQPARRLHLERVSLAAGAALRLPGDEGPRAILSEQGTTVVALENIGTADTGPRQRSVAAGDVLALPAGPDIFVRNLSSTASSFVLLTALVLPPAVPGAGVVQTWPEGVTVTAIAPAVRVQPIGPGAIVTLSHATLLPGAQLTLERSDGATFVSAAAGSLDIATVNGWVTREQGTWTATSAGNELSSGQGVAVAGSGPLLLWNDSTEPARLLAVTIRSTAP